MQLVRRKKTLAFILGLFFISLLVVRDIYTSRAQSDDSAVLEVRQYSSAFRVLFSKLHDKEAIFLQPKGESDTIDSDTGDDGGIVENEVKEKSEVVTVSLRLHPLTQAPPGTGEDGEDAENEEQKLHAEISQSTSDPLKQNSISSSLALSKEKYLYDNFVSNSQRQKTTVNAIKKLLLHNETESAKALWNVAQNQNSRKKSSQTSDLPSPTTTAYKISNQFHVKSHMSWPLPQFTRADILQAQWIEDLKQYLQRVLVGRQVSVVTANLEHQEVVLNWLISAVTVAKLSPRSILVLSLSAQLHDFLISKKMNSIFVHPTSVMNNAGLKRIRSAFNQVSIDGPMCA